MLVVRDKQIRSFEQAAWRQFEREMIAHSKAFAPRSCDLIGGEKLHLVVRSAINRARAYGFTNRGPIRLFIELMFLHGSSFDKDPQHPGLGIALRAPDDQMHRAMLMHEESIDYSEKVSGPGAVNLYKSLRNLLIDAQRLSQFTAINFVTDMLQEMEHMFPEKVAYTGRDELVTLIHAGRVEAGKHGFATVRGEAMIVLLMFAFGLGCTADPLYPWISRTLQDQRIIDPAARVACLEQNALAYLDNVITGTEQETLI